MQDNEVRFKCGQKVFIEMVFASVSYASTGAPPKDVGRTFAEASSRTLDICKRIIKNDHVKAEAYFEAPVLLIYPSLIISDNGSCDAPPYWCAAKLWTISDDRKYRYCCVQWYQDRLVPDISGFFSDWAASINWTSAVDSLLAATLDPTHLRAEDLVGKLDATGR